MFKKLKFHKLKFGEVYFHHFYIQLLQRLSHTPIRVTHALICSCFLQILLDRFEN